MEEPVAFQKSHFSLVFWGREVMITHELGSISLLSLVPFTFSGNPEFSWSLERRKAQ